MAATRGVRMSVLPGQVLVDEVCEITVSGLTRAQPVTVCAQHRAENDVVFVSHAHYTADETGSVHVASHASTGGSYQGVEAMGLFWSLDSPHSTPSHSRRLMKTDVTSAQVFSLYVVDGHQSATEQFYKCPTRLATTSLYRWYMAPGVQRYPVKSGRLVATLFLPPGPGPFPAVVDLYGLTRGLLEHKAALLASRGFAALALCYQGGEGQSQSLYDPIELEYFNEAIEFLMRHPKVRTGGVGIVGLCRGASLACAISVINPNVRAVVAINGSSFLPPGTYTYRNKLVPFALPDPKDSKQDKYGEVSTDIYLNARGSTSAVIKVEEARNTNFLFVTGDADQQTPPAMSKILASRLMQHFKSNYRLLVYPGTGHQIEPPYTPLCKRVFYSTTGALLSLGGEPVFHAVCQREAWTEMLAFLRHRLCPELHTTLPHSRYLCDPDPDIALQDPWKDKPVDPHVMLKMMRDVYPEHKTTKSSTL